MAKINKLTPDDISGSTITLSNIGGIGGKFGSPLINSPEVAIIGFGRIQKIAQFAEDGDVYPASVMTVCCGLKTFTMHPSHINCHAMHQNQTFSFQYLI